MVQEKKHNEDPSTSESLNLILRSTTSSSPMESVTSSQSSLHSSRFSMEIFKRTQSKLDAMKEKAGISRRTLTTFGTDISGISYAPEEGSKLILDSSDERPTNRNLLTFSNIIAQNVIIGDDSEKMEEVENEGSEIASTKLNDDLNDLMRNLEDDGEDEKNHHRRIFRKNDIIQNHSNDMQLLENVANTYIPTADGVSSALITRTSVERSTEKSNLEEWQEKTHDSTELLRAKEGARKMRKDERYELDNVKLDDMIKKDKKYTAARSGRTGRSKNVPHARKERLPAVMMRKTTSSRLRDDELRRKKDYLNKLKSHKKKPSIKVSKQTANYDSLSKLPKPVKKKKEKRKSSNPSTKRSKNKNDRNRLNNGKIEYVHTNQTTGKPENSNIHLMSKKNKKLIGETEKLSRVVRRKKTKGQDRKEAMMKSKLKNKGDELKISNVLPKISRKKEDKNVEIFKADSVPEYVSDDNKDLVSEVSDSIHFGDSRRSLISNHLQRSSWEELFYYLVDIGQKPQQILESLLKNGSEAFHTIAWKSPPALAQKFYELISPSEYDILMSTDEDGNTPLHLCCANLAPYDDIGSGKMQIVNLCTLKALLERVPECLKSQNRENDTPLHSFLASPLVSRVMEPKEDLDVIAVEAFELISEKIQSLSLHCYLLKDSSGATPLHTAIANEACEIILMHLIDFAPNACKSEDRVGMTPLHYAAAFMKTPAIVVERMIEEYSYSICHKTQNGDTPLHLLIRNSCDRQHDDVDSSLDSNSIKIVNLLLGGKSTKEADLIDDYCPLLIQNREMLTPLQCFALFVNTPFGFGQQLMYHPSALKALKLKNAYGATPLHICVANKNVSLQTLKLLGRSDSVMVDDHLHRTPLHVAAQNIHASVEVIRTLLELNPLASEKQSDGGYLPMHFALHSQATLSIVKELHNSYPSGIERESLLGDTPLHRAASNNVPIEVVEFLLDKFIGAVHKQNQLGDLPLHCATKSNNASSEVVEKLLKAWPSGVSTQNRAGNSPLHYLVGSNAQIEVVALLVNSAQSSVLLLNSDGKSPLVIAKESHASVDVINLLESSAKKWTKQALDDGWSTFGSDIDLT